MNVTIIIDNTFRSFNLSGIISIEKFMVISE